MELHAPSIDPATLVLSPRPNILIVAAPFYRDIADHLIEGASAMLSYASAHFDRIEVPGALEIAPAIRFAADGPGYDGYIALGCVIRGETTHYELVCAENARGLTLLGVKGGLAIGNGVLTVENRAQADIRADPAQSDKGGGAAIACLTLVKLRRRFAAEAAV
jgi:6,7-dimethyl-8-ribityllumazine synthase